MIEVVRGFRQFLQDIQDGIELLMVGGHMQKVVGCIADVMGALSMFSVIVCTCCTVVIKLER